MLPVLLRVTICLLLQHATVGVRSALFPPFHFPWPSIELPSAPTAPRLVRNSTVLLVGTSAGQVLAFAPDSGLVLWSAGPVAAIFCPPVELKGEIYATDDGGHVYSVEPGQMTLRAWAPQLAGFGSGGCNVVADEAADTVFISQPTFGLVWAFHPPSSTLTSLPASSTARTDGGLVWFGESGGVSAYVASELANESTTATLQPVHSFTSESFASYTRPCIDSNRVFATVLSSDNLYTPGLLVLDLLSNGTLEVAGRVEAVAGLSAVAMVTNPKTKERFAVYGSSSGYLVFVAPKSVPLASVAAVGIQGSAIVTTPVTVGEDFVVAATADGFVGAISLDNISESGSTSTLIPLAFLSLLDGAPEAHQLPAVSPKGVVYLTTATSPNVGQPTWRLYALGVKPGVATNTSRPSASSSATSTTSGTEEGGAVPFEPLWLGPLQMGGALTMPTLANADRLLLVGDANGDVTALNASTGSLVWNVTLPFAVTCSPTMVGSDVYVLTQFGRLYRMSLSGTNLTFVLWLHIEGSSVSFTSDCVPVYDPTAGHLFAHSREDSVLFVLDVNNDENEYQTYTTTSNVRLSDDGRQVWAGTMRGILRLEVAYSTTSYLTSYSTAQYQSDRFRPCNRPSVADHGNVAMYTFAGGLEVVRRRPLVSTFSTPTWSLASIFDTNVSSSDVMLSSGHLAVAGTDEAGLMVADILREEPQLVAMVQLSAEAFPVVTTPVEVEADLFVVGTADGKLYGVGPGRTTPYRVTHTALLRSPPAGFSQPVVSKRQGAFYLSTTGGQLYAFHRPSPPPVGDRAGQAKLRRCPHQPLPAPSTCENVTLPMGCVELTDIETTSRAEPTVSGEASRRRSCVASSIDGGGSGALVEVRYAGPRCSGAVLSAATYASGVWYVGPQATFVVESCGSDVFGESPRSSSLP